MCLWFLVLVFGFFFLLRILPVIKINNNNKTALSKMTAIAVHFHEHLAAIPFRKFKGAE